MNSKNKNNWATTLLGAACGLLLAINAHAEVAYVTDMLQLDMYQGSDFSGSSIRKLRSGDRIELISKQGRSANVRTEDGLEGWVKSLYLVADEPARARLSELEKTNGGLESTVKKLRAQLAAEKGKVSDLQQVQDGSAEQTAAKEQELLQLREDNADMIAKLKTYADSVPVRWLFIAFVISLLGGFAGGWYLIDRLSRAKHGGYRIY